MEVTIRKKQNNLYINNKKVDIQKSYCFIIGNIYNLDDLYKFEKKLKTEEKILKLYELYQEKIFKKFNGEYALILIIKGKIILVRDRLGSKNLYYYQDKEEFICTNNLANIIKRYKKRLIIDKQVLANYLYYTYILPPYTIFKNVFKLETGSFIIYDKKLKKKIYYNVIKDFLNNKDKIPNEEEAVKRVKENLRKSLELRIKGQKEIGVFFSAGVDSTLVASLLKEIRKDVNTYTIGFYDKDRNEAVNAKKIAKVLNTNHQEFYLKEEEILPLIRQIPTIYADLFSDPSMLPILFLTQKLKNTKVFILTGDGADQLYCGSKTYDKFKIMSKYKISKDYLIRKIKREKISFDQVQKIYRHDFQREKMIRKYIDLEPNNYNDLPELRLKEQIKYMLYDVKTFMSNRLFTKLSCPTNYYNISVAHPFIDNNFIKTTFSLDHKFKYKRGNKKYILKKILFQNIPEDMINNSKKGFGVPLEKWTYNIFKDEIKKYSLEKDLKKQNLFNVDNIKEILNKLDNQTLKTKEVYVLFSYYIFQLWYYTYIDKLD